MIGEGACDFSTVSLLFPEKNNEKTNAHGLVGQRVGSLEVCVG